MALKNGLESFKSDSLDFILQHQALYPLTIVLFYDSTIYLEAIIESLASKILDVFLFKFEKKFHVEGYRDYTPTNKNYEQISVPERN